MPTIAAPPKITTNPVRLILGLRQQRSGRAAGSVRGCYACGAGLDWIVIPSGGEGPWVLAAGGRSRPGSRPERRPVNELGGRYAASVPGKPSFGMNDPSNQQPVVSQPVERSSDSVAGTLTTGY